MAVGLPRSVVRRWIGSYGDDAIYISSQAGAGWHVTASASDARGTSVRMWARGRRADCFVDWLVSFTLKIWWARGANFDAEF